MPADSAAATLADSVPVGRAAPNLITAKQMLDNRFLTVYDAVASLHSNWLQARGPDSFTKPTEVRVYLDNTSLGGISTLHEIATNTVTWVKYFDGISATGRWGLGHGAGVIFVSTHPATSDPQLGVRNTAPGTRSTF